MSLWQDANGNVFDDDDGRALSLLSWPRGLSKLTSAQSLLLQTPPPTIASLENAVQSYMDSQAQLKGYDNIMSACSYASTVNPYQADGISFLNWRAACWQYCFNLEAQVKAGTAPIPTASQLIASLPVRV